MLTKGDVLAGRYVIEERVGSGGYGSVYRARDRKKGGLVAVKVLRGDLADDPDYRRRFRREADIARLLTGEHVVRVLETGDSRVRNEDVYFQVMEFVEGQTLHERLKKGRIPVRKALYVAAQIADALVEAESRGIVHCDIKPKNIFVGKAEFARLGDFGVARATEYPSLKPDDPILGTPRYMSPEQCLGHETDSRSDIYSLGAVLYEMISGRPPFEGDSPNVIAFKHVNENPRPMKATASHAPDAVEALVKRCLEKLPEDRFHHASELREALWSVIESLSSAEDTPITPVGLKPSRLPLRYRIRRLNRLLRSPRVRVGLTVTSLAAVVAVVSLILLQAGGEPEPKAQLPLDPWVVRWLSSESESKPFLSVPPDRSWIAFGSVSEQAPSSWDIWLMHPDGSDKTKLATIASATFPQLKWSPVGDQLAYCSDSGELGIMTIASPLQEQQPTIIATGCAEVAWSPSGEQLAYTAQVADAFPDCPSCIGTDIWTINRDGSGATPLTSDPRSFNRSPAWSPDGHSLAFVRTVSGDSSGSESLRMEIRLTQTYSTDELTWAVLPCRFACGLNHLDFTGSFELSLLNEGGLYELLTYQGEPQVLIEDASVILWSPSREKVAFTRAASGGGVDLWVRDPAGAEKKMTSTPGEIGAFTWSPDSQQIAYDFSSGGGPVLQIADTRSLDVTTALDQAVAAPAWSPGWVSSSESLRPAIPDNEDLVHAEVTDLDSDGEPEIAIQTAKVLPICQDPDYPKPPIPIVRVLGSQDTSTTFDSRNPLPDGTALVPLRFGASGLDALLEPEDFDQCWPSIAVEMKVLSLPGGRQFVGVVVSTSTGTGACQNSSAFVLGMLDGEFTAPFRETKALTPVDLTIQDDKLAFDQGMITPFTACAGRSGKSRILFTYLVNQARFVRVRQEFIPACVNGIVEVIGPDDDTIGGIITEQVGPSGRVLRNACATFILTSDTKFVTGTGATFEIATGQSVTVTRYHADESTDVMWVKLYADEVVLDDVQPTPTPQPTPTLSISGKVVYVASGQGPDIYVVDERGRRKNLTSTAGSDTDPAWSPDGTKIAFVSDRDAFFAVYVMNSDGSNQTRLTDSTYSASTPVWSPDGSRLAFSAVREGNMDIYIMNSDGSNISQLTSDPEWDLEPDWSPDGSKLAFTSSRQAATPEAQLGQTPTPAPAGYRIWVMNVDGSNQTPLTPNGGGNEPAWSPDGQQIVYSLWGNIHTTSTDGGTTVQLTTGPSNDTSPIWSPDGSQIAFVTNLHEYLEIFVMNADGSHLHSLGPDPIYGTDPDWAP